MFQFTSEQFRVKVGLAEMLKGGVIMENSFTVERVKLRTSSR